MIPAKVALGVIGTVVGVFGLTMLVFAKLFEWAAEQCAVNG